MIVGNLKSEVPIEFCGDEKLLASHGHENLRKHVSKHLSNYSVAGEIVDVLVYCKRFEKSERPLVFTSLTINTTYGPVSGYGIDYNIRNALNIAIKNSVAEMEKAAAEQLYGSYKDVEGLAEA
ncbi:MAG TPA: hypothetical protein VJG30_01905 [Candidatus Nanoarchaeia archaeon]|nr:hypothetical protein [Candidatus Nanoarchaeia archaeon]